MQKGIVNQAAGLGLYMLEEKRKGGQDDGDQHQASYKFSLEPGFGEKSRRRVMYVPVVTGKYMPKDKNSKTPFYHRFAQSVQN